MNITITLGCAVMVLIFTLILVIKIAYDEHKQKLAYKSEAERKSNTIDYLYQHAEELQQINDERRRKEKEIENAETDEEVLAVVGDIVDANNNRVRK